MEHRESTFIIAWGEFSLTLEDVLNIMSLPLYSDSGMLDLILIGEDKKRVKQITEVASYH